MRTLFLFFFCCICASCFKIDEYPVKPYDYTVDSIPNIVVPVNSSASIPIYARITSGNSLYNLIHLTVSGTPSHVHASVIDTTFSLNNSFSIDFKADSGAALGTYPIILTSGSSGVNKIQNFKIIISDCADSSYLLAGHYYWNDDSPIGADSTYSTITKVSNHINRILIPNALHNIHQPFYVDMICGTRKLKVPFQSISGYFIYGSGSYGITRDSYDYLTTVGIVLLDTLVSGVDTTPIHMQCTWTY